MKNRQTKTKTNTPDKMAPKKPDETTKEKRSNKIPVEDQAMIDEGISRP